MRLSSFVASTLVCAACTAGAVVAVSVVSLSGQQVSADAPPLTEDAAKALKNPIPNTLKSIARGKLMYGSLGCSNCHGTDGKALIDIVANATDLTEPKVWKNGTEEGLVFRSLRDGAGVAMPPFKMEVTAQEDLWHLVNFIRNLWPQGQRPPVAGAQD